MSNLKIGDKVIVDWIGGAKRYEISSNEFVSGLTGHKKHMVKDKNGHEQSAPVYLISKI